MVTALITSAVVNEHKFTWSDSTKGEGWLTRIFLESSEESSKLHKVHTLESYYKPRFLFAFGLPSLLCHLVGSFLLLLQYKLVHPWRQLGREREANLWGKLGGAKQGVDEEMSHWRRSDAVSYEELVEMKCYQLYHFFSIRPGPSWSKIERWKREEHVQW